MAASSCHIQNVRYVSNDLQRKSSLKFKVFKCPSLDDQKMSEVCGQPQGFTPSNRSGPLHLPHVGQEEPGVDIAGDNVQERDHPENARPSNKSVTNPEVAAGLKPSNKMADGRYDT